MEHGKVLTGIHNEKHINGGHIGDPAVAPLRQLPNQQSTLRQLDTRISLTVLIVLTFVK